MNKFLSNQSQQLNKNVSNPYEKKNVTDTLKLQEEKKIDSVEKE